MARGRQPGAPKTGGRKKGAPNKATAKRQAAIEASGLTPLDFMLQTLRDTSKKDVERMAAAVAAAPYVHPKLAAIQHTGKDEGPVKLDLIKRIIVEPGNSDGGGVPPAS